MLLLKWNAFSCAYMFFIKFACSPKWFSLSFVHYYNSSVCENQPLRPSVMARTYAVSVRNSDNNEKFIKLKITSLIFEMIFTANGKFIHFTSLKTQRNILW